MTESCRAISHHMEARHETIWIAIPVYNDWVSVSSVIAEIAAVAQANNWTVRILLLNDGSTESAAGHLQLPPSSDRLKVHGLDLKRNLGHQRAIAIGLAFLCALPLPHDALVVVMDGDGEDRPADLVRLVQQTVASDYQCMVFAKRAKRSEGVVFRSGLTAYRLLHRLLTGKEVDIGNFSCLPSALLSRLVGSAELWSHYAAAADFSKLPMVRCPLDRGQRVGGRSKMNLESLVLHGLSAISIYVDRVAVRIFLFLLTVVSVASGVLVAVMGYRLTVMKPLPGWLALGSVAGAVFAMNGLMLATVIILGLLKTNRGISQNPALDWAAFCQNGEDLRHQILSGSEKRPAPSLP